MVVGQKECEKGNQEEPVEHEDQAKAHSWRPPTKEWLEDMIEGTGWPEPLNDSGVSYRAKYGPC